MTRRRLQAIALGAGLVLVVAGLLSRASREMALDWALRLDPPQLQIAPETSWVSLGDYDEFRPTRFEQLPDSVRVLVDSILDAHLGLDFRRQLTFVHGQVVDHSDSVARAMVADFQWPVFSYRLGFELIRPAPGVEAYVGYVTLYPSAGREPTIEFPPVRARPERALLVPLHAARDTAAQYGVIAVGADLEYDGKDSVFYYVLFGRYRDRGMTGTEPFVVVNAHTGQFVRRDVRRWIE